MKLCILHCAKHGVYAISVESQNGGIRITPNKCCGSWHTVREFKLSPAAWDELSKAAESAARRGRAARKEAAMSEVKPVTAERAREALEDMGDGPKHYERAVREIKALRAEVANWKRVATIRTELHDESESRAERAEAALAELLAERDALAAALEAAREDAEARVAELEALFRENARKAREQAAFEAAGAWDDAAAAIRAMKGEKA